MTRVVRNTAILGGVFPAIVALSLLQAKVLTTRLGPAAFGAYASALAIGALLAVGAELGLTVTLSRMTAALEARGAHGAARRVARAALGLSMVLALVLFAGVALAAAPIGALFRTPLPARLVLLGTAFGLVGALRATVSGVFYGLRDAAPPALADLGWLAAATTVIVLLRGRLSPETPVASVTFVIATELLAQTLAVLVLHVLLWRRAFAGADAGGVVPWTEVRRFAAGAFSMSVLGVVMENVDKPLIGRVAAGGFATVALFHVANKVVYYGRRLLYLPLSAVGPEFTRRSEHGTGAAADLALVTKMQMLLALLLWALAAALARPVVETLTSADFDRAAQALAILALVLPLSALYTPAATALRAVGTIWPTVLGDLVWTVTFVGAGWALLTARGIVGLAWAQVAAAAATGAYTLLIARRRLAVSPGSLIPLRGVAAAIGALGLMRVMTRLVPLSGAAAVLAVTPVGLIAYVALVRSLRALDPAERARLLDLLKPGRARGLAAALLGPGRSAAREPR